MVDLDQIVQPIDFAGQTNQHAEGCFRIDAEDAAKGLGRLAVAIVNLLHELLERQAIRRIENGTVTDEQAEELGACLMKQSEAIDQLCDSFGIKRDDLNLDLGPLGNLV